MVKKWFIVRMCLLLGIAGLMVVVQLVNSLNGYALNSWGIQPRNLWGLTGIVCAPWLHGDWAHLLANLPALCMLGGMALLGSIRRFVVASVFVMLIGGMLVWLFGRSSLHIGASGWVFGLWAWLIASAWFQRNALNAVVAMGVIVLYGGMWYGVLPQAGISFESHLAGIVAGVVFAWGLRRREVGLTHKR